MLWVLIRSTTSKEYPQQNKKNIDLDNHLSVAMLAMAFSLYNIGNVEDFGWLAY